MNFTNGDHKLAERWAKYHPSVYRLTEKKGFYLFEYHRGEFILRASENKENLLNQYIIGGLTYLTIEREGTN